MTPSTLSQAMGGTLSLAEYERKLPGFEAAMLVAGITTVRRAAMWCAQLGHESVGLRYYEEIADGSAYEGRRDLGNIHPGDGKRFKGHGPIQVTGRNNHTLVSRWAHREGLVPTETYFVDHPKELATDRYGPVSAAWYWTVARDINSPADRADVAECTRLINGGYNGLDDRKNRYQRCLALGKALLPTEGDGFDVGFADWKQEDKDALVKSVIRGLMDHELTKEGDLTVAQALRRASRGGESGKAEASK